MHSLKHTSTQTFFYALPLALTVLLAGCPMPTPTPPASTAPVIEAQSFSVLENIAGGSLIGRIVASDPNGDAISFFHASPASSPAEALFALDPQTGNLSLTRGQSLDFEATAQYSIPVQVHAGGESAGATITINIQDALEPDFSSLTLPTTSAEGRAITLNASGITADLQVDSYLWEVASESAEFAGTRILSPNSAQTQVELPFLSDINRSVELQFRLTLGSGSQRASGLSPSVMVTSGANRDADGDGLIEIRNLTQLHNMRFSLGGANGEVEYLTSATDTPGETSGCPANICRGYELVRDLNFDLNGNGNSWSAIGENSFALDGEDNHSVYFNVANGGWQPIGSTSNRFTAIFYGNGHNIYNLAINRPTEAEIGLFAATNIPGYISSINLVNSLTIGSNTVGPLAAVAGSSLVANSSSGRVRSSEDNIGGLTGITNNNVYLVANYSQSDVNSNATSNTAITGGLIGSIGGNINAGANYASGSVVSRGGSTASLIGLFDAPTPTTIIASYATGNTTATTLTGNLIGFVLTPGNDTITQSFGFGTATATNPSGTVNSFGTQLPGGITSPADLTLALANGDTTATAVWNSAAHNTLGAWDFTRRAQNGGPSLRYADYDGPSGNLFYCDGETAPMVNAGDPTPIRIARCGEHLPHQFANTN